jgi:hypothetical protein
MKTTRLDLPVMASWMESNGRRLDCNPYLSGGFEARVLLERLKAVKQPLKEVTQGGIKGVFNGPRFSRCYVSDKLHGVPLLSGTEMLQANISNAPLISKKLVASMPHMVLTEGTTLISSYGTIGRTSYCRKDMAGMVGSDNVLKVIPDTNKILSGYLYAFLSSKFGVSLVVSELSGSVVTFLDPSRVAALPVPRLGDAIESQVHELIVEAARLRTEYQHHIQEATNQLFESVGLKDITAVEWHKTGPDLGFFSENITPETLRALNFNPRLKKLFDSLSSVEHRYLGDICGQDNLQRSLRFSRVDSNSQIGVRLIGQRELFWLEPEGRWIAPRFAPKDIFVEDETILLAALGTLGESEVFGRCELITGSWLDYAYSDNIVRICSRSTDISGAFLFAFLRSETVFRCFRSLSIGSKQQVLHGSMLSKLPVPVPDRESRSSVEKLVREGFKFRHSASAIEKKAITIIEEVLEGNISELTND